MTVMLNMNESEYLGDVAVDACLIGIGDPFTAGKMQADVEERIAQQNMIDDPQVRFAVVVQTTHGDGLMPVFEAQDENGRRWAVIALDHDAANEMFAEDDEDDDVVGEWRIVG